MTIGATLQRIASEFLQAKQQPLTKHPLAEFIRGDGLDPFKAHLQETFPDANFLVTGSPGQGNWAEVPWIGVFLPAVTDSATKGYYVVYLFSADMRHCYLSMAQGTTAVREEFRANEATHAELLRRSALMRARVPEYRTQFADRPLQLGGETRLAKDYEPSVAFYAAYDLTRPPQEEPLKAHLAAMAMHYQHLFARGGVGALEDSGADEAMATDNKAVELIERRRYRQHRSIERNSKVSKEVKKQHGHVCQGCGFDFGKVYGEFGQGYIEAHHLTPLSSLDEDVAIRMDPKTDFAVLCANCHRMMHRKNGPRSISDLQGISGLMGLRRFLTGKS